MLIANDIFIIDNNNFKQQKTQTYGYKWLGNEGFFINVTNENNTVRISRSCLAPYIAYYDDNSIYCISNSINSLVLYLETQGKTLTKSDKLLSPTTVCYDTQIEEIKLIPIDKDIYIDDTGLHLEKNNRYFSKPFNPDVIEDWFNSYKLLFNQIAEHSTVDLSAGQDSRILYSMVDKTKINLVHSSTKKQFAPEYYITNLIAATDEIKLNTSRMNLSSTNLSSADTNRFSNYSDMDIFQFRRTLLLDYINYSTTYYYVMGTGTESYKSCRFMNDLKIPELWGVKYHSKNLISYYDYNVMFIYPFTDSRLMSMKSTETEHILDFIYKNFIDEKYLNIPFYNSSYQGQYYYKYTDYVFLPSKDKIIERLNPRPDYYIEDITIFK